MALSVAVSNSPRASPDWLVASTTVQSACVRRAMACRLPGSAIHSSGDLTKASLSWLTTPSRSRMISFTGPAWKCRPPGS
ncbi:Uncharacterised protein [Bordetella pertussis]|nr:Uncharacterised protein [Bordetella pertussis]